MLCSVQTLLFCVLQNVVVQVWSHVHSAVDQDENKTISDNETIEVEEEPTIIPEVPLLILVLILH